MHMVLTKLTKAGYGNQRDFLICENAEGVSQLVGQEDFLRAIHATTGEGKKATKLLTTSCFAEASTVSLQVLEFGSRSHFLFLEVQEQRQQLMMRLDSSCVANTDLPKPPS